MRLGGYIDLIESAALSRIYAALGLRVAPIGNADAPDGPRLSSHSFKELVKSHLHGPARVALYRIALSVALRPDYIRVATKRGAVLRSLLLGNPSSCGSSADGNTSVTWSEVSFHLGRHYRLNRIVRIARVNAIDESRVTRVARDSACSDK